MSNFRMIDRERGYLLPPSVDEWLPEKHLARFIVDVIDGLDLGRMSRDYRGAGSGFVSSNGIVEYIGLWLCDGGVLQPQAGAGELRFGGVSFLAANDHPDHDTIATFRRRFLKEIEKLFVDVLRLAREMVC
jgi:hypothetical protein